MANEMTYRCQDCSYKGGASRDSMCPACGSPNMKKRATKHITPEHKVGKPYRLIFVSALWLYLLVEMFRKWNS